METVFPPSIISPGLVFLLKFVFPRESHRFVRITSRDGHRAMFPSQTQENFYSQRDTLQSEIKSPRGANVVPIYAFKISPRLLQREPVIRIESIIR